MSLIKPNKSMVENMPQAKPQSLAVAYSVKRKNQRKKMAQGGAISAADESRPMPDQMFNDSAQDSASPSSPMQDFASEGEASAGPSKSVMQNSKDISASDEHYESIADAILAKKRKVKMMADGGEVDLEANSREDLNNEDEMSFEAGLKEQYDDDQISEQPHDSNEMGHELSDEDSHDMVDSIRKKMKAKGRL